MTTVTNNTKANLQTRRLCLCHADGEQLAQECCCRAKLNTKEQQSSGSRSSLHRSSAFHYNSVRIPGEKQYQEG